MKSPKIIEYPPTPPKKTKKQSKKKLISKHKESLHLHKNIKWGKSSEVHHTNQ